MRRLLAIALWTACSAPRPATPPAQLPPLDQIVRTCAFEVSCLQHPPTDSIGTCVNVFVNALANYDTEFRRYVDCANAAADCTGVLACAARGHDPTYCAAHPGNSCDGDLVVSCGVTTPDWAIFGMDCAALGMRCAEANGTAVCTDGSSCDPAASPSVCDGNRAVACDATTRLQQALDCSRSGVPNATCRYEYTPPTPGCRPTGASCNGDRCAGDLAVRCIAGEEFGVDCAQQGSHCFVDAITAAHCTPTAADCSGDACAGDGIAACVGGAVHVVACAGLGLSTCAVAGPGRPVCR